MHNFCFQKYPFTSYDVNKDKICFALTIKMTATGPMNAHIVPFSTDNQHLKNKSTEDNKLNFFFK